jgi:hypothetical protein
MKLDVLVAMHLIAKAWRLTTPTTFKNCFVMCGFSVNHVGSKNGSAVKLGEDEGGEWENLQPHRVQFKDCTACDSALEVCGIQSVVQVLGQQLTRLEEEGTATA